MLLRFPLLILLQEGFSVKLKKKNKISISYYTGLMSGMLGQCFFKHCYNLFGELMDALALLNGAINFVLYCSMSKQFRTTFRQIMLNKCAPTARATSHTELQTTYV